MRIYSPEVLLVRYAPVSRPAATHVPHTVAAKDANSSKRSGLNANGANMPGKLGSRMIAVICEHRSRPLSVTLRWMVTAEISADSDFGSRLGHQTRASKARNGGAATEGRASI